MHVLLAHGAPAGGAPLEDALVASGVAVVAVAAVALIGWAHRTGRITWLARLGSFSERVSGLPAWAALPGAITGVALVVAVFGYYWDVSTHIDNGRDAGPFANPAHYFILFGLAGIALAGAVSMVLGCDDDPPPSAVRLRDGWQVPVGGLLLLLCGAVALAGFPLDDVWHRIFGQDVTLWGPTHIQMIAGASLATLAQWLLFIEAGRVRPADPGRARRPWFDRARNVGLAGALLIGLSTLQGEFDFGVPQFSLLFHPVLIVLAASIGLVAARVKLGRGGALLAAGFYVAVRGALTLVIGVGLDRVLLHFPLYLVEAALVELVAARVSTRRPVAFGAWSGVAIGTVGLAAEWAWSHVWMPLPWPGALLPEIVLLALPTALAGGLVGAWIGDALLPANAPRSDPPRWLGVAAAAVIVFALAWPLPMTAPDGDVRIELDEVASAPDRSVHATVAIAPPELAEGAYWLTVTAWQGADWGDEQSVVNRLERVERGVWRTTEPIPVHGDWKALVRLQNGRATIAAPIYLPADEVIDAPRVEAESGVTRGFVADKQLLQREARDRAAWLWNVGYAGLGLIGAVWIAALAWGLRRVASTRPDPDRPAAPRDSRARPGVGRAGLGGDYGDADDDATRRERLAQDGRR